MSEEADARLRPHQVELSTARLRLRPLTEEDWPTLLRWNQDPRVLRYSNDGDTRPWSLEMVQTVYRKIAEHALVFLAVRGDLPIAECWLQEMNLETLLSALPDQALYRIDLAIGDPADWGQGLGPEIIGALVEYGFRTAGADALFACHLRMSNVRSQRAFAKKGFRDWGPALEATSWDGVLPRHFILTRNQWAAWGPRAPVDPPSVRSD